MYTPLDIEVGVVASTAVRSKVVVLLMTHLLTQGVVGGL